MTRKIDSRDLEPVVGSAYPAPFDVPCRERVRKRLGDAASLTHFGVNLLTLPPGAWSSQRHWHTAEDEFVYVVAGEVVLVTEGGEEVLHPGDCAGFPAGASDGHHLQNRSGWDATVLEIGSRRTAEDDTFYPDIDMQYLRDKGGYVHRDGTPYPPG